MDIGTKFKFMTDRSRRRVYTAAQVGHGSTMWHVTWPEMLAGGTTYSNAQVIDSLRSGVWTMVSVEQSVKQSVDPQAQIKRLAALATKGFTITFRPDGTLVIDNDVHAPHWQLRTDCPEYYERVIERAEASVG